MRRLRTLRAKKVLLVVALCALVASTSLCTGIASAAFDARGKETLRLGGSVDCVLSDHHGRILLCGQFFGEGSGIVRLRANGSFDRSFGDDGFASIGWSDVLVRRDGRIMVLGTREGREGPPEGDLEATDPTVTRLRPNGTLDPTFGKGGVLSVDLGRRLDRGSALAIAPGGRIWVGGTSATYEEERGGSDAVTVVGRLTADGKLDRTFSQDGLKTLPATGPVADFANESHGGVLVASGGFSSMDLFRLRRGGAFERPFGHQGSLSVDLSSAVGEGGKFFPIEHVGMLPDGRFILAGTLSFEMTGQNYSAIAARFLANGKLDVSYGVDGVARAGFPGFTFPVAFAVGHDGQLVIGADTVDLVLNIHRFGAIAFRPNGDLDRRFGHAGMTLFRFPGNSWLCDLVFQGSDRIVAVGFSQARGQPNATSIARIRLTRPPVR
jgi:uncharacterized delta-60 repeat protein